MKALGNSDWNARFRKLDNQLHQLVRFNFEHGRRVPLFQGGGSIIISLSTCTDYEGTAIGGKKNLVLLFVNLNYFGKFTSCNMGIVMARFLTTLYC